MIRFPLRFLLLSLLFLGPTLHAAPPPNIILIMTDDQGYGDFGLTGNPLVDTPHLDDLGATSTRLSHFYVSPVCSPTRASLMTGRYNYRTRVVDTWAGRSMMEPNEVTIAETLRAAGYHTGIFGKWHLGDCYPMRAIDQGFDEALVHHGGGLAQLSDPIENEKRYTDPLLWRNGRLVRTRGFCTDVFFDAALDFIDESHATGRPFFAYLAPNAPHGPFDDVPMELYQKYRDRDLTPILAGHDEDADKVARIFAMVENIDQNVGRLLQHLAELDIERDTIVIFLTDNGPATRRYVGPFRGKKNEVNEGGIRTVFYFRWPTRLLPGVASAEPTAHIDIMPTLLAAADVPVPAGVRLDGRSLLPLLERRADTWSERTLVLQTHRGRPPEARHHFAVIQGPWKWLHPTGFAHPRAPDGVPYELYNLAEDSGETHNLAAAEPAIAARLATAYDAWFDDVSHTRPDNFAPPRILVGPEAPALIHLTRQERQLVSGPGWAGRGYWVMEATEPTSYIAEAIFREPVSGRVQLLVNQQVIAETGITGQSKLRLPPATFTTGPFDLACVLISKDDTIDDAYQVMLHRESR